MKAAGSIATKEAKILCSWRVREKGLATQAFLFFTGAMLLSLITLSKDRK